MSHLDFSTFAQLEDKATDQLEKKLNNIQSEMAGLSRRHGEVIESNSRLARICVKVLKQISYVNKDLNRWQTGGPGGHNQD